jgi:ABC-type antimicrobial peptide transport system permease subunit
VNLAIAAGELVAVLGPSGSGKSTLLHLAGTLDRPASGTVRITGLDVATLGDRALAGLRASGIGFVFQQFFLAEHASVATDSRVTAVDNLLGAQTDPEDPGSPDVSVPSAALVAQADAKGAFSTLFLGLGAVALLVGAIGVANIMVIAVLERRSEIGLRRALGATRGHIRIQFLSEAVALALVGGAAGVVAGAAATALYAHAKGWAVVIPAQAWAGGLAAALLIGALAGLLPALKAARLSPTEALWTL